jgi:hypothetical protein
VFPYIVARKYVTIYNQAHHHYKEMLVQLTKYFTLLLFFGYSERFVFDVDQAATKQGGRDDRLAGLYISWVKIKLFLMNSRILLPRQGYLNVQK